MTWGDTQVTVAAPGRCPMVLMVSAAKVNPVRAALVSMTAPMVSIARAVRVRRACLVDVPRGMYAAQ